MLILAIRMTALLGFQQSECYWLGDCRYETTQLWKKTGAYKSRKKRLGWVPRIVVVGQSLDCVQLFVIPWTAAHQTSLPFTTFQRLLKLRSIESVIPSNHLIFCQPLLCLNLSQRQSLFQRVGSSHQVAKGLEFQLHYQSFQWIFRDDFLKDWLVWSPCCSRDSRVFSITTVWKHQFITQPYGPILASIHDYWKNHNFDYMVLCQQSDLFIWSLYDLSAFQYAI